ncbi:lipid II:glycine glycyltransferase FemX [Spirosoma panaciterrae]|uniref:lipid II:glycine glycyltransferase FemX n=1 Tax=Spirosoma panaciterrae TaxID=496058 RepID=UPI000366EB73|nr:peptidoglycan bridge formation glycyltransferase FemA/FemB family protein [Spirosoma panaciterrae]
MKIDIINSNLTKNCQIQINDFLLKYGSATTFFQSPSYFMACLQTTNKKPTYILLYSDDDKLIGVLLYVRQNFIRLPLAKFMSSRDIIIGGPVVKEDNSLALIRILDVYIKQRFLPIYSEFRNLFDQSKNKEIFAKKNIVFEEHLNILVDISKDEESLRKSLKTNAKRNIQKSIKEGCEFSEDTTISSLKDSYKILKEVYERAKLPLPSLVYFENMLNCSTRGNELKNFKVKYNNETIACMLCVVSNNMIYEYYTGAFQNYFDKYPNYLLTWEIFMWGKKHNINTFDFGGAGKPNIPYGVREYKLKFGGELINYGRFTRINYPLAYKISVRSFNLLRRIINKIYK